MHPLALLHALCYSSPPLIARGEGEGIMGNNSLVLVLLLSLPSTSCWADCLFVCCPSAKITCMMMMCFACWMPCTSCQLGQQSYWKFTGKANFAFITIVLGAHQASFPGSSRGTEESLVHTCIWDFTEKS